MTTKVYDLIAEMSNKVHAPINTDMELKVNWDLSIITMNQLEIKINAVYGYFYYSIKTNEYKKLIKVDFKTDETWNHQIDITQDALIKRGDYYEITPTSVNINFDNKKATIKF
jgi:hypothetical protein